MIKPSDVSHEGAVRRRYAAAAQEKETALCCPVQYDSRYLEALPDEVIERDYGCGDPSQYLREGETVLDLGSGTGKICFNRISSCWSKGQGHRNRYDRRYAGHCAAECSRSC